MLETIKNAAKKVATWFRRRQKVSRTPEQENLHKTFIGLCVWAVFSIVVIALYSFSFFDIFFSPIAGLSKAVSIFAHANILAGAFLSIGFLLGFLFGIPRTLQHEISPQNIQQTGGTSTATSTTDPQYRQLVNTNLEQISDWLTKILVGVGLTQLNFIPQKLIKLGDFLKPNFENNSMIPLGITLNFTVLGFFSGYLLTRLFFARAFYIADRSRDISLKQAKRLYNEVIARVKSAIENVTPATPKDVKKGLYEEITKLYLYQYSEKGFEQVIEYANRYNKDEPTTPSARIWFHLACAYGQQYKYEQELGNTQVLATIKQMALLAVQETLRLDPQMKSVLKMVWDPNQPGKVAGEDNDLEVFKDDPDFKNLLGPVATAQPPVPVPPQAPPPPPA